jgi:hypothetical protein
MTYATTTALDAATSAAADKVNADAITALASRVLTLEASMANVVLTITKLGGTVSPPAPPPPPPTTIVPPPIVPPSPPPTIEPTPIPYSLPGLFIAPSGSDSTGDGSVMNPWLTIQKFISTSPNAGTTLGCRGGAYNNPPSSIAGHGTPGLLGTATAPITIRNYPGEVPIFSGGSGPLIGIAGDTHPSAWVIIDGIQLINRLIGASGGIYVGGWPAHSALDAYNTEHITIRNYKFTAKYGDLINSSHGCYAATDSRFVTFEDSVFIGAGPGGQGGDGITCGTAVMSFNDLTTIQRCVFTNFAQWGLSVWGETGPNWHTLIDHCTFIGPNGNGAMRIENHGPTTVTNCATTESYVAPTSSSGRYWMYHVYNAITDVVQNHNFFSQTFDSTRHLLPGNTGIGAASDGTNAGALA